MKYYKIIALSVEDAEYGRPFLTLKDLYLANKNHITVEDAMRILKQGGTSVSVEITQQEWEADRLESFTEGRKSSFRQPVNT